MGSVRAMMGYGNGYGMHDGTGWVWILVMVLFLIAIAVTLGVLLLRDNGGATRSPQAPRSADDGDPERILRQRFARGEIDTEEFETRLSVLSHG